MYVASAAGVWTSAEVRSICDGYGVAVLAVEKGLTSGCGVKIGCLEIMPCGICYVNVNNLCLWNPLVLGTDVCSTKRPGGHGSGCGE